MNRRPNALIGAAAADISGHGRVDILVAGMLVVLEQRDGLHDQAGLAVAALGNAVLHPSLLHGMQWRDAFNGGDFGAADLFHGSAAGADSRAILVHGAGSAEGHAAAEFRSRELRNVAQIPQQRHVWIAVKGVVFSVHFKTDHWSRSPR